MDVRQRARAVHRVLLAVPPLPAEADATPGPHAVGKRRGAPRARGACHLSCGGAWARGLTSLGAPFPLLQVGFLYLRYVADPRTLWSWFEDFFGEDAPFSPSPGGKAVPLGLYVRELLLDQYYFETIFPRIPETVSRQIKDGFARAGFATVALGCGGVGGSRRGGGGGAPPSVKAALAVSLGQRAPHVSGGRESGRGFANVDPGRATRDAAPLVPAPPAAVARAGPRDDRPPQRNWVADGGERGRERRRSRSRERSRERRRSRSRDQRRSRSPPRHGGWHGGRRERSRSRERGRDERRDWREPPPPPQQPTAAEQGRPVHDVFRSAPPPAASALPRGRY